MMREQLQKLKTHLATYNEIETGKRNDEGALYNFRQHEQAIIDRYYPVISICFTIARIHGKNTRYLYFKQQIPSRMVKNSHKLHRWVVDVLRVIAQRENNLLDPYKDQLIALEGALVRLLDGKGNSRADRENATRLRKQALEQINKTYQILKLYLKGWFMDQNRDFRPCFKELRLTPASKQRVEHKTEQPQLEAAQ